ncbi:MAG: glucuronate isomerase, partial [Planctomycetia bacterium]
MDGLTQRLYDEIRKIPLIDPHSHVVPHAPVARNLGDLLGYHYYTELAHSAGLPKSFIEDHAGLQQARNVVGRLVDASNTVQYGWMLDLTRTFFGFDGDELSTRAIDRLWSKADEVLADPNWTETVFRKTNLEAIFLTNDFDDPLENFDTARYVPCLRTDDLVFKLSDPDVRQRLVAATGVVPGGWNSIGAALDVLFERFVTNGARACAVSLPPDFAPVRPAAADVEAAMHALLHKGPSDDEKRTVSYAVFYSLADRCEDYNLPFDLMIGVHRGVYVDGVHQGRDLFDKSTSLYQYRALFNEKSR